MQARSPCSNRNRIQEPATKCTVSAGFALVVSNRHRTNCPDGQCSQISVGRLASLRHNAAERDRHISTLTLGAASNPSVDLLFANCAGYDTNAGLVSTA